MASTEEGTHKLSDGIELYTKTWKVRVLEHVVLETTNIRSLPESL